LSISMEEALGLNQPEEGEEEFSEADLKRFLRRKLVFERRARGDTIEEIVSFCQKNGYPVTERTIFRDLRSDEVCSLIDELVRVQLRDIAMLRGYALQKDPKKPDDKTWKPNFRAFSAAIGARGFMISCLKPKVEPKVKVNVNVSQTNSTTSTDVADLLAEYREIIAQEAATSGRDISKNNPPEQVDST
jgi:hypothetical protein